MTLEREMADVLQTGAWTKSAASLLKLHHVGPRTTAWLLVAALNFEACVMSALDVAYGGGDSCVGRSHRFKDTHDLITTKEPTNVRITRGYSSSPPSHITR